VLCVCVLKLQKQNHIHISMLHHKQSVKQALTGLEDLITRIQRCNNSDSEKESAMHQWTTCCLLNNQSAPHTMDFIFAKPWRRLTLTTIEDAIVKDMAMLNERIKKEKESLVNAQKLHDGMIKMMKKGKKRAKPEEEEDVEDKKRVKPEENDDSKKNIGVIITVKDE
jgi:hypothetical protein